MTFTASTSPDITEGLPGPLSTRTGVATTSKRGQVRWDISVDGIGFVLGIDDQHQYVRESAPVQKQQTDVSADAGEQTLDGLWIRSQTSWHLGAGARFYEPGARDGLTPSAYRYDKSVGVNVWDEGDLTLLKATSLVAATAGECHVASARSGGVDYFFTQTGTLKRWDAAGASVTYTGSPVPTGRVAIAGGQVLVGTATTIAAGSITGSTLTDLWTGAASAPKPYWAKDRVIAVVGRSLYELSLAGGTWPATALFTHPDADWTWTSVTESPNAILAAGYSGGISAVYSFTLETNTSGTTPKLGQPFRVAEMPTGEEIRAVRSYLGAYIGIGTTKGLRVGILSSNGLQYGPLLFKTTQPVVALGAFDRYMYAAVAGEIDGGSGCARVDLGATIGDGLLFPWAWDAQTHDTTAPTSLAFVGNTGRVVVGVTGKGAYVQSATAYESTGYLRSGSIRYGTTESKAFRFADVRCKTDTGGTVALALVGPTGEEVPLVSLTQGATGTNLSLASVAQRLEYVSYKLTLTPSLGNTPTVESVALKAVPAVKKQRMIQYPVMMQDRVHDAAKAPLRQNIAELIMQIEALEETKAVVTVNDYRTGESFSASIESFRFEGATPSTGSRRGDYNVGGRGTLTVRKL